MNTTADPIEDDVPAAAEASQAEAASVETPAETLEDGRTRCEWVRGRPEHYDYHDAEFGRTPDSDAATFECFLIACFWRGRELTEVLDQRLEIYEAFGEWNPEAAAGADDEALSGLSERGGVFADEARLKLVREIAQACVEVAKDYKGLRNYVLALPYVPGDEKFADIQARFPGFDKEDASRLVELLGTVEGCPHQRDCWIA